MLITYSKLHPGAAKKIFFHPPLYKCVGIVEAAVALNYVNRGEPLVGSDSLAGKAYMNICRRIMGEEVPFLDLNQKHGVFEKLKDMFKKN